MKQKKLNNKIKEIKKQAAKEKKWNNKIKEMEQQLIKNFGWKEIIVGKIKSK